MERSPTLYDSVKSPIENNTPITAIIAKTPINFKASSLNENLLGLGNKMDLTNYPFIVEKPIYVTNAITGGYS